METWDYWDVKFSAFNANAEANVVCVDGTISVAAYDIFEALEVATAKLKTFGFDIIRINGGKRLEDGGKIEWVKRC